MTLKTIFWILVIVIILLWFFKKDLLIQIIDAIKGIFGK